MLQLQVEVMFLKKNYLYLTGFESCLIFYNNNNNNNNMMHFIYIVLF